MRSVVIQLGVVQCCVCSRFRAFYNGTIKIFCYTAIFTQIGGKPELTCLKFSQRKSVPCDVMPLHWRHHNLVRRPWKNSWTTWKEDFLPLQKRQRKLFGSHFWAAVSFRFPSHSSFGPNLHTFNSKKALKKWIVCFVCFHSRTSAFLWLDALLEIGTGTYSASSTFLFHSNSTTKQLCARQWKACLFSRYCRAIQWNVNRHVSLIRRGISETATNRLTNKFLCECTSTQSFWSNLSLQKWHSQFLRFYRLYVLHFSSCPCSWSIVWTADGWVSTVPTASTDGSFLTNGLADCFTKTCDQSFNVTTPTLGDFFMPAFLRDSLISQLEFVNVVLDSFPYIVLVLQYSHGS